MYLKYAWIEVKNGPQKKIWAIGITEWGFREAQKPYKNHENAQKLVFLNTPKISLIDNIGPKFLYMGSFWLKIKQILLWNHLKII